MDKDVDVKFVSCGECHTVAISKTGVCYAWGNANSGRLGVLTSGNNNQLMLQHALIPQEIDTLKSIVIDYVACGAAHTLFVAENGWLYATGCNMYGQVPHALHYHLRSVIG